MQYVNQLTRGDLVVIDRSIHRVLALIDPYVLLAAIHDDRIYLVQADDGSIGLPTGGDLDDLRTAGRLNAVPQSPVADGTAAIERMEAELDMLRAARVPMGTKAIYLFLRSHWTPELVERFGPHDDAATVRRWYAASRTSS